MTLNAHLEERPLDVVVGRNVHMLMWDRRLTQAELGAKIGMDQSSLGKRLRGERGWTLDQVAQIAGALDTSVSYLIGETADRLPSPLTSLRASRDSNPQPSDPWLHGWGRKRQHFDDDWIAPITDMDEAFVNRQRRDELVLA